MNKTLVIGCGFLGSNIFTYIKNQGKQVIGTNYQKTSEGFIKLDITDFDSVNQIITKENPDLVINCAATTNVDELENNEELAYCVNGNGPGNIAKACKQNSSKLIHISTDAVFDGKKGNYKEEETPKPLNVYGKSKLLGETFVKKNSNDFIIIRTNMFGYDQENRFLFNWIYNSLKAKKQILGFEDIIFNPLEITILSKFVIDLSNTKFSGIIHLGSNEIINKYDFCCKIGKIFDFDNHLIKKGQSEEKKFIANRPKNTSLSNSKAKKILETDFPSLNEQITKIKVQLNKDN